ncbi:Cobalt-zinc-cadmium resistance protein CzcA; Cation efflux system protein CusA [hydrothermal vent metagenome]|uniref:Cobalt-zinc-cadmium resistance protein CzcA Cation efflux system protein CusA n=1 Tax=hydrothermal vent metagenome TaxID=652676 RepID=A0A3B1A487_9ZZZZ
MLRWIISASLQYRFIVLATACAMMVYGIAQLRDMPIDVFPEFAPSKVEIQTPALGLSPTDVEALITIPLEEALSGMPGLDVIRSKSVPQLSSIQLYFNPDVDELTARQLVNERVAIVTPTLPTWAAPPFMMPPLSATSRVMKIGLSSNDSSLIDLSMIAYWKIRASLLGVPGVANIAIWGERLQMLQVQVDQKRMQKHNVTLDKVLEVTSDALEVGLLRYSSGAHIGTGGFIDTPNQRLGIRNVLPIVSANDLAQIPIFERDGKILRLGDVANLVEDHQPLIGDAIINDGPGLMLIVEKYPWGNTLDVTRGVEDAINRLRPSLPGVDIDTEIFRPATYIETSISNLNWALIVACILVVLVLFTFLFEWRTAVISIVAIPLSLIAAALVLYFQGSSLNTMVLAGFVIAIGAVVDDAIIDIENIMRRLRENHEQGNKKSITRIILEASLEVRSVIIFATLIIVFALIPVFFLEGLTGAFFQPLALSYVYAILASMVVALTVTPAMSLLLLRNAPLNGRKSPVITVLQKHYGNLVSKITQKPRTAYTLVTIVLLVGIILVPVLGHSLLPSFKERDFLMHFVTPPGTSHQEMVRITKEASKELRAIPGVRNFGAHIGQALLADEVVGINFTENWISVDPSVDYDKTVDAIKEVIESYPGLYRDVLTYLKERIREVLTGAGEAIVVRIYGKNIDVLRKTAENIKMSMSKIDGIVDLHVGLQKLIPHIQVKVDLAIARKHGLKPGDVRRAAATLLAGTEVGDIFRDGKTYDIQVWSTPETRKSLTGIRKLLIDTPSGVKIQLGEVADIRILPTPNVIKRQANSRYINVEANVDGRDLASVAEDVEDKLEAINFPLEYHAELLGEYETLQEAQERISFFSIIAVIGIFFLLQLSFSSWRLATIAIITLPAALVGGVIAVFFSGGIVSLGSLVGFLTVLGIAARNGIMMINHFQHLEMNEGVKFGLELVQRGARERLAPILMTATTTGFALLPLVFSGDLPGYEIEHPMAVVIIGGLITSTLINLFVIPVLYLRYGAGSAMEKINIDTQQPVLAG